MAAAAGADPDVLRLHNLDSTLRVTGAALGATHAAIDVAGDRTPMRCAIASLLRLAVGSVLMLSLIALGLGRHSPAVSARRVPAPASQLFINHLPGFWRPAVEDMLWLDAETGQTTHVPLRGEPMLQAASLSPWRDENGSHQVVGFRAQGINKGGIVLERASFPDGAVLDAIEIDVFANGSRVCWYPGTRARVLFIGGDNQLYMFDFERDASAGPRGRDDGPMDRPRPLAWTNPDSRAGTWFGDLHWPAHARFAHLILARSGGRDRSAHSDRGLAWLRLGEAGDSVEEWGRLLDRSTLPPGSGARSPSLGVAADGRLLLAYLEGEGEWRWSLRVTPIVLEPDGRPRTVTEPGRVVAEGCLVTFPAAFSRDGRFVNVVIKGGDGSPVVQRIELDAPWSPRPPLASMRSDISVGRPGAFNCQAVDKWVRVGDAEGFRMARALARSQGLLVGGSSGTAVAAALRYARRLTAHDLVVAICPDTWRNYMSKFYDDERLAANQLSGGETLAQTVGDLTRARGPRELVTVAADATAAEAVALMEARGTSQLPVLRAGRAGGSIQEVTVARLLPDEVDPESVRVGDVMARPLRQVDVAAHLDEAYRLLLAGNPGVLAVDGENVVDVVTRIDLIHYWGKRRVYSNGPIDFSGPLPLKGGG